MWDNALFYKAKHKLEYKNLSKTLSSLNTELAIEKLRFKSYEAY
jgi:hypothetical protein